MKKNTAIIAIIVLTMLFVSCGQQPGSATGRVWSLDLPGKSQQEWITTQIGDLEYAVLSDWQENTDDVSNEANYMIPDSKSVLSINMEKFQGEDQQDTGVFHDFLYDRQMRFVTGHIGGEFTYDSVKDYVVSGQQGLLARYRYDALYEEDVYPTEVLVCCFIYNGMFYSFEIGRTQELTDQDVAYFEQLLDSIQPVSDTANI